MQPVDATCPCGKPRTSKTCYRNKKHGDGLQNRCRECDNARSKKRPSRRGKPLCKLCAGQAHRVVGGKCLYCGLRHVSEPPVRLDFTSPARESAFAAMMREG